MPLPKHEAAPIWSAVGVALTCLLGVSACAASTPRVPAGESLSVHMHDHFTMALRARDGVIRGDLSRSQAPLIWLSQHTYQGELPPGWKPYVQRAMLCTRIHCKTLPKPWRTWAALAGHVTARSAVDRACQARRRRRRWLWTRARPERCSHACTSTHGQPSGYGKD
jgi:hypothetical protein